MRDFKAFSAANAPKGTGTGPFERLVEELARLGCRVVRQLHDEVRQERITELEAPTGAPLWLVETQDGRYDVLVPAAQEVGLNAALVQVRSYLRLPAKRRRAVGAGRPT